MTQPILQHFGEVFHHDDPLPAPRLTGPGRCTLVATSPGKSQLLSASAMRAVQEATVLLVDDLVSPSVVALAKPGARVIHLGKRNAGVTSPAAFVEKLILMAVREGEQVVHLQSGESLTDDRRLEETTRLQAAGVNADSFRRHADVKDTLWPLSLSQNLHNFGQLRRV